jgi:hypothetical protein
MRLAPLRSCIVLLAVGSAALASAPQAVPAAAPPRPSFKPGAAVTLAITVKAPEGWKLSHTPALRIGFNKELLKNAPFTVKQDAWQFKFKTYVHEYTATIPITLKPKALDGEYALPLSVACSICDEPGLSCAFADEGVSLQLIVRHAAPSGEKEQAQAKGTLAATHVLHPPR